MLLYYVTHQPYHVATMITLSISSLEVPRPNPPVCKIILPLVQSAKTQISPTIMMNVIDMTTEMEFLISCCRVHVVYHVGLVLRKIYSSLLPSLCSLLRSNSTRCCQKKVLITVTTAPHTPKVPPTTIIATLSLTSQLVRYVAMHVQFLTKAPNMRGGKM